jgi:hypothetical protein
VIKQEKIVDEMEENFGKPSVLSDKENLMKTKPFSCDICGNRLD